MSPAPSKPPGGIPAHKARNGTREATVAYNATKIEVATHYHVESVQPTPLHEYLDNHACLRVRRKNWTGGGSMPWPRRYSHLHFHRLLGVRQPQLEKRQHILHSPRFSAKNVRQRSVIWCWQHLGRMSEHEHADAAKRREAGRKVTGGASTTRQH